MTNTTNRQQDGAPGYLLLRATIGTNICIHGLTRLLAGLSHLADKLVPAFQHTLLPAPLGAPVCSGFILGGKHHRAVSTAWNRNATCTHSRISSHPNADLRCNAKSRLGKRWSGIDPHDCLLVVGGFRYHNTFLAFGHKKSINSRTTVDEMASLVSDFVKRLRSTFAATVVRNL